MPMTEFFLDINLFGLRIDIQLSQDFSSPVNLLNNALFVKLQKNLVSRYTQSSILDPNLGLFQHPS